MIPFVLIALMLNAVIVVTTVVVEIRRRAIPIPFECEKVLKVIIKKSILGSFRNNHLLDLQPN
jgi:hypothetical protein